MTIEEIQAFAHRLEKLQEEIVALARSTGEWNPLIAAALYTLSGVLYSNDPEEWKEFAFYCRDFSRRKIAEIQRRRRDGHDA